MGEQDIQNIEVMMIRPNLENIPTDETTPPGYRIRTYQDGDGAAWVRIHELADKYNKVTDELYQRELGYDIESMRERSFFIETETGEVIGTASAWFNPDFEGEPYGRVHWVAIVPEHQGKGLARPLLSRVMERLAQSHNKAYLITSSARIPAIHLYLKFGFQPFLHTAESLKGWDLVRTQLEHPLLSKPYLASERLLEVSRTT